jgi:glutathione synthase/RimK-type ligase-like ATP-grasp enzyme
MTWLILVDQERDFSNADTPHKVMTTKDYLSRPQLFRDAKPKIINLARSYGYQGAGYYCSLLAEARGHRIMPPVGTMAELSRKSLYEQALPELEATLGRCMTRSGNGAANGASGPLKIVVCFGQVQDPALVSFGRLLFDWFRVPVLRVTAGLQNGRCHLERVAATSVTALGEEERAFFTRALDHHTRRNWRDPRARSQAKYSLAVLIDPSEPHPPSSQASLRHLAKVAQKFSIEIEPITKGDLDRLAEYDALFIRATTSIDNFTYRFARRAEQEGMPVIDDPQSMIRCTNKVYLAERLSAAGVPTPRTLVVQGVKQAASLGKELGWPVVLKIPDGSFSRGVFKCDDLESLLSRLKELLGDSDLVIAQEFLPTAFDWRIGVLAGEALFACQYHMVKKHWQIMKYKDGKTVGEGRFTTMALDSVPHGVVETAVRAARLMGQGFYGVDLKQTDTGLYVIEVNDNPDLNHGIEDAEEKDVLWEKLVKWFWDRLEA